MRRAFEEALEDGRWRLAFKAGGTWVDVIRCCFLPLQIRSIY